MAAVIVVAFVRHNTAVLGVRCDRSVAVVAFVMVLSLLLLLLSLHVVESSSTLLVTIAREQGFETLYSCRRMSKWAGRKIH